MVWGSNFKHSSVRLEETIYIKYLCCKKSRQWNINTWRQVQVWYHGEHQMSILRAWCFTNSSKTRILRFAAFRPFYITSIYGLGKAANPPDISVVGVCDFTKFRIPPPLSFELKTMSRIFPCPGAEKSIHPLVFPDIFPWLARGPTPGASRWHVHNVQADQSSSWLIRINRFVTILPHCSLCKMSKNGNTSPLFKTFTHSSFLQCALILLMF